MLDKVVPENIIAFVPCRQRRNGAIYPGYHAGCEVWYSLSGAGTCETVFAMGYTDVDAWPAADPRCVVCLKDL